MLFPATLWTVLHATVGICLGFPLAFLFALWLMPFNHRPFFIAIGRVLVSVPLLATITLFVCWFGGRPTLACFAYVTTAIFVYGTVYTLHRSQELPPPTVKLIKLLSQGRHFPAIRLLMPEIWERVRPGIKNICLWTWAFSVGGEFIASQYSSGLGYLLQRAYSFNHIDQLLLVLVLYLLLGIVTVSFINYVLGPDPLLERVLKSTFPPRLVSSMP